MEADSRLRAVTTANARALVGACHRAIEARKQQVNDLNVYPVPDGDTGTNLLLSVRAVVADLANADDTLPRQAVCDVVTNAALMGARGNSGVILSQIVRGAMEALAEMEMVSAAGVVKILRRATDTAYRAVRKPVEGTILTVLREMTEAAEAAPETIGLPELLALIVHTGWKSVERTPTLLKVLADAGVVDAGGYGLMVMIEGMVGGETGEEGAAADALFSIPGIAESTADEHGDSIYTYCTTFLLKGVALDGPELERQLDPLGDSLLVVGTDRQLKIHVHTDEPGVVLGLATARGVLLQVAIDNMKIQTAERDARLAAPSLRPATVGKTQVVAVVAGAGMRELFQSLGAGPFVEGGQSMNPSAEEIMNAVAAAQAPAVLILPNNKNIVMAAEQVASLAEKSVAVLPTHSMQVGLSAMVGFDPENSLDENLAEMTGILEEVLSGEVTRAVRDCVVDDVDVREGAFIGLVEGKLVASGDDFYEVARDVTARLLAGDRELVTALIGEGDGADSARAAVDRLREEFDYAEFEAHEGGQPLYPLLLAAE
ncbi:MAG: DAK2 domain-containing protein [Actinobacteria bacterium]|nr:DAK2 domain-containing protein [Actinomycetota bacterium]